MLVRQSVLKLAIEALATPAGLEPATCRLEGGCSIQLSYGARASTTGPATRSYAANDGLRLEAQARIKRGACPPLRAQWVHGPTRLNLKLSEYAIVRRFGVFGSSMVAAMPLRWA